MDFTVGTPFNMSDNSTEGGFASNNVSLLIYIPSLKSVFDGDKHRGNLQ